jgi:cholesterol oxidase
MDGAVIPMPIAVNPLLTISAIAERACDLMAADQGWTIDLDGGGS